MMISRSPRYQEIVDLLSEKGPDWMLLSGLQLLVLLIGCFRLGVIRGITDDQLLPLAQARWLAKEEARKTAGEPVEY